MSPILLAEDFNDPNIDWRACMAVSGTRKREFQSFLDVLSLFSLIQMVSVPTRSESFKISCSLLIQTACLLMC